MSIKQLIEAGGSVKDVGMLFDPKLNKFGPDHEYTPGVPSKKQDIIEESSSLVDFMKTWNPKLKTDLKSRQEQFGDYYMDKYKEKYTGTAKQNDKILEDLRHSLYLD